MTYQTRWLDYGNTSEPCPKGCGRMLRWTNFYDKRVSKSVRALKCPNKKCGPPPVVVGESKVKGTTEMERFNARMR